jgi:hypothetical protein
MEIEASCRAATPRGGAEATTVMSGQNKQFARRSVEALTAGGAGALERIVAEDSRAV